MHCDGRRAGCVRFFARKGMKLEVDAFDPRAVERDALTFRLE